MARDPIAFVEACYALGTSETEWLEQLAKVAQPLMNATTVLAYHIDIDASGAHIHHAAHAGEGHGDIAARILGIGKLFERQRDGTASALMRLKTNIFFKSMQAHLEESVEHMLLSELDTYGPRWAYTLGAAGVRELLFMINHHIDGHGATYVVGALPERGKLPPASRELFQQLGAHVKAGLRLRRRLPEQLRSVQATVDGAVLDASARLVHAEGEAREPDVRAVLEQKAREIDTARSRRGGRDQDALAVWQGLIEGRWSLVERFDRDGKRFLLAHKNAENVRDPRGLTELEARVTRLALRGYSDKLIAYHLGVTEGAVASRLAQALRKLGFSSRVELVRTLGRLFPLDLPHRSPKRQGDGA